MANHRREKARLKTQLMALTKAWAALGKAEEIRRLINWLNGPLTTPQEWQLIFASVQALIQQTEVIKELQNGLVVAAGSIVSREARM